MFRWTSHNWKWIVSVLVVVAVVGWIIGDWKWFLGVLIPAFISVAGWIYVSRSDKKHIKEEKTIAMKIDAFNNIKGPLLEASRAYSNLGGFVLQFTHDLSSISSDNQDIYYEAMIKTILKDFESSLFKKLIDEASENFIEFVRVWEQHELLLKPLLIQRHALQSEHNELILNIRELHTDYYAWLYSLAEYRQLNIDKAPVLQMKFDGTFAKLSDFSGCLLDVSYNIQNYAFSELLKDELDKRRVLDEKYLTIDTLIKKHNIES